MLEAYASSIRAELDECESLSEGEHILSSVYRPGLETLLSELRQRWVEKREGGARG